MAGFTNAIIFLFVYYILVVFHIDYLLANVFAFFISVLNAYFWNTKFVFKKYNAACVKTLIKVYTSYSITFVLSTTILYIAVSVLGFSKYIAPIFSLFVTVPLNFILNKLWIFKKYD
jgi:putative flippase GtrA